MALDFYGVLDKIDIARMGKYKRANNQRVYRCPFHDEKTGSFYVNENFYKCFGCGKGGNAVRFLAEYFNISTKEAYKRYCELSGIAYDRNYTYKEEKTSFDELTVSEKILYSSALVEAPTEYLRGRGITELKTNKIYIMKKDFRDPKLANPIFKNCLIVPIYNAEGKLQNIQYITPNNQKFYLKEHTVKNNFLELIIDKNTPITFLVEGVIDGLTLNLAGYNAVVCFNAENLKAVALSSNEYFYNRGYVFADNDEVGKNAGEYASRILGTNYIFSDVTEIDNKKVKDANDILKLEGLDSLKKKIELFLKDNVISVYNYLLRKKQLFIYNLKDVNKYKMLIYKEEYLGDTENSISKFILNNMVRRRLVKKDTKETPKKLKLLNNEIVNTVKFVNNETYAPDYKYFDIVKKYNKEFINIYQPSGLHANKNLNKKSFKMIYELLLNLTNNDEKGVEWFLDFLACKWQKPHIKHKCIIVFQGEEGTGKNPLGKIMKELFGDNANISLTNQTLESEFNTVIKNKLILCVDEASEATTTRMNTVAKLKAMSGSNTTTINEKGKIELLDYPDLSNIIMYSNEEYVAKISKKDTRYVIFKSYLRCGKEFFDTLFKPDVFEEQTEGLAYHLQNRELKDTFTIYENEAKEELKELSKDPVIQLVEDLALTPNQIIAEVASVKKIPLVYKIKEYDGMSIRDTYENLKEDQTNPFYYNETETEIIMSTQQFVEIVRHKTGLSYRNNQYVYTEARKTGIFEYDPKRSVLNCKYGQFRICKIKKLKEEDLESKEEEAF